MTFPRAVRYSTLARFIFSFALMSLLVVIFTVDVLDLIFTMSPGLKGRGEQQLMPAASTEERIKTLMLAIQVLEANVHECRADKSRETSENIKFLREENDKLNKKVHELLQRRKEMSTAEKNAHETELTVNREFFDYLANHLRNTTYPGVYNYTRYTVARLGLAPLVGVEPLMSEFGPVINDVLSFTYPITVPSCQDFASAADIGNVFIVVNSAPTNFGRRDMIRQTWKNYLKTLHWEKGFHLGMAGFAFFLGQTQDKETQSRIEEESDTFGDIIQIKMADFYDNLSLKVAGQFNWLYKYCAKVDFVLKVDDDVYVNVRNLAHFVQSYRNRSNLAMFGSSLYNNFNENFKSQRDGKWNISFDDWPWEEYPPYLLGPAVIFHGSIIFPLLAAFQTTPMIRFDDVYYTGICAEKAGVKVYHSSYSSGAFHQQQQNYYSTMAFTISVLSMELKMSGTPVACDLRRFIAWLVDYEALMPSVNHMNSSHIATDNFYRNVTQCTIATKSATGIKRVVDYTEPVQFDFTLL